MLIFISILVTYLRKANVLLALDSFRLLQEYIKEMSSIFGMFVES